MNARIAKKIVKARWDRRRPVFGPTRVLLRGRGGVPLSSIVLPAWPPLRIWIRALAIVERRARRKREQERERWLAAGGYGGSP